jgi:hypothetical protein
MNLAVIKGVSGGRRVLAEVNASSRCRVDEQITALDSDIRAVISAVIDTWLHDGSRGVEGGYWGYLTRGNPKIEEWKPEKHVRIHWYADGKDIILIWVTGKNQQKAKQSDITRAVKFAKRYNQEKKRNGLRYI